MGGSDRMARLGVVGSLVWDTIVPHGEPEARFAGWGGIAYALEAMAATLGSSWELFPIIKVGGDLFDEARAMLASFESVSSLDGMVRVPEPNNRVELRYTDAKRRREILTGGVPGWTWAELQPLADRCDALYVNFIAGWELDRATADRLGAEYDRPMYLDVHSLVLDVGPDGDRIPRVLEDWERWIGSFDVVQLNDDELASLLPDARDPLAEVGRVLDGRPSAVFVTRGREGVDYVACANVTMLPGSRATPGACSRITGRVGIESHAEAVDPTGCGDVWGAVCFGSLLDQVPLEEAMRAANRAATSAAQHRGATGLAGRLKLETDGGDTDWSGENEAMKR